jgi:hypothetical protein
MSQGSTNSGGPAPKDESRRAEDLEPAARKMDVDEDYDDDGDDEKRTGMTAHERKSPVTTGSGMHSSNGMMNGLTKTEV